MIKGLTNSDIKDIANGNAKYNRFVANLDKDELLEELATRLDEKYTSEKTICEDFADSLSSYCYDLYDCIEELDLLADGNDKLVKISEKLDEIHTNLCKLKDDLEDIENEC